MKKNIVAVVLACCLVVGCSTISQRVSHANDIAAAAGFRSKVIDTGSFKLTSFYRLSSQNKPINVYIEGDGLTRVTTYQISQNPTPIDPVALDLAVLDDAPNVVYIARPCQYTSFKEDKNCEPKYWDYSIFSEKIISSVDKAIGYYKDQAHAKEINLIGYSGGGGVAALLAARRDDVVTLRTVAGNLNHKAVTGYHDVSPLTDSLNPIDYAENLSKIPQHHFVGDMDTVVPVSIAKSYAQTVEKGNGCVNVSSLKGVTHYKGWSEKWKYLLEQPVVCLK